MTDILVYAVTAGLLLATITGPLGALVVWQRMAYYGDTLAHSALMGVALGLALQISVQFAVILTCVAIALALAAMQRWRATTIDSLLGIFAHSGLALGLVAISLLDTQVDLNAFLFGDLLAVAPRDLAVLGAIVLGVGAVLWRYWTALVAVAAHAELAAVEGVNVDRLRLLSMVLIAVTVAIAMKVVGVLLITAMLIVPAATASRFSRSPEQVALGAVALGMLAVVGGLAAAWMLDTPAGATIVVFATLLFVASQAALIKRWKKRFIVPFDVRTK